MHICLDKDLFLKVLSHQNSVIERRSTMPILSHVLLEASSQEGGRLTLSGTDLDVTLVAWIPCDVKREGSITLPIHTLYDIVRKLPDGVAITLESLHQGRQVSMNCPPALFTLPTLSTNEFPDMTPGTYETQFEIHRDDFHHIIDNTRFAMSSEEARYNLNGIYLHSHEGKLRAVGTDAYRLAMTTLSKGPPIPDFKGIIISRKTVGEIHRLLANTPATALKIHIASHSMMLQTETLRLTSRLIEGQFPRYNQAIPAKTSQHITVDAKALGEAVERVSMISTERLRPIHVHVTPTKLILSAYGVPHASSREEINAVYSCTDTLDIGFNTRHILDVVQHTPDNTLVFSFNDASSPMLLCCPKTPDVINVIRPLPLDIGARGGMTAWAGG